MKVKELIKVLQKYDRLYPDAKVLIPDGFTTGFYQEAMVASKSNVKEHREYETIFVDEDYLDKHETKGDIIEIVCID